MSKFYVLNIRELINKVQLVFKMPFYAVAKGRKIGIFNSWPECETQVKGYAGAKFKKFPTEGEARTFISINPSTSSGGPKNGFKKVIRDNLGNNFSKYGSFSTKNGNKNQNKPSEVIDLDDSDEFDKDDSKTNDIINSIENKPTEKRKSTSKAKKAILLSELPERYFNRKRPGEDSNGNSKRKKFSPSDSSDSHEFTVDDNDYVEVYTDGSCINNGTKKARAGLGVYFGEDHPLNISAPVSGRATNNCGEIQAATKAIQIAHSMGVKKLAIKTDSQFVINSVTKWMQGQWN